MSKDLGFGSFNEPVPSLFEELLSEINAVDSSDLRDGYLSDLALSLREHRLTEQALQVIRAIWSPYVRCEAAVEPGDRAKFDAACVREALGALAEIDDAEDQEIAEDLVARALAATGQKAEALQLIAAANDEFRRCWRELSVAEGFVENGDFSAALECTSRAADEFCGRFFRGLSDSMYGDAAALFSRIGEFDRAVEMAASSNGCRGGYMAAKIQEVCGALVGAGRQQQAIDLARSVPELGDAAPAFIVITEDRARSGELGQAIALLDETAAGLLHVLSREAAQQPKVPYVSDRGSLEHRTAAALNQVAAAYFRMGQVERAIGTMTHPIPDGADRNLISLRAQDSRVLAVQAAVAGDLKAARTLLDCALVCAKAISPNLPYERAERLGRIVAPELLVGRPETALSVWTTLEESNFDLASFLNACVQIGTDCGTLQTDVPDRVLTSMCGAIDKA